jgi:hypothetical protein
VANGGTDPSVNENPMYRIVLDAISAERNVLYSGFSCTSRRYLREESARVPKGGRRVLEYPSSSSPCGADQPGLWRPRQVAARWRSTVGAAVWTAGVTAGVTAGMAAVCARHVPTVSGASVRPARPLAVTPAVGCQLA